MSRLKLMQGNEACVEGALYAGMRFYAGYPITPSTEIAELSAERLPFIGGKFIQMEDEIASMAAVIGASLCGIKSMTATSGPGFSLKQENLGFASMTEIPCVIVNVQRGGPSTGLPTSVAQGDVMQSRWGTHGDHPVIVLCPSSVKECYELTVTSFNYSEKYRTPVILLMDEVIGHMREKIELPDDNHMEVINRKVPPDKNNYMPYKPDKDLIPPMAPFGEGYKYHVTGLVHSESGFPSNDPDVAGRLVTRLNNKIVLHKDEIALHDEVYTDDADILIVAFGCTSRAAHQAVINCRNEGINVGLFRPKTIWPFPEKRYNELAKNKKHIIVPELNLGQLILEIQRITDKSIEVIGINKVTGEMITPEEITARVKEVL